MKIGLHCAVAGHGAQVSMNLTIGSRILVESSMANWRSDWPKAADPLRASHELSQRRLKSL